MRQASRDPGAGTADWPAFARASRGALLGAGVSGLLLLLTLPGMGRTGLLGPGAAAYPQAIRSAVAAARAAPGDPAVAAATARLLIKEGQTTGDAFLVQAALNLLEPSLDGDRSPEMLLQAAVARQYLHEFTAALALLDEALAAAPENLEARFTRANILIVRGQLDRAADDCATLARHQRLDVAVLCDATVKALSDAAPQAYRRLAALTGAGLMDPKLKAYAFGLLGEMATFLDWPDRAGENLRKAIDADPRAIRTRVLQADLMLSQGTPQAALDALEDVPDTDAVLVRRAIAHRRLGAEEPLRRLRATLDRRFARNIRAGDAGHAREEARYFLQVANDPSTALARARANWERQHEYEDAWLLIEAARAEGSPEAALPVRAWMQAQAVTAPALRIRLEARS